MIQSAGKENLPLHDSILTSSGYKLNSHKADKFEIVENCFDMPVNYLTTYRPEDIPP